MLDHETLKRVEEFVHEVSTGQVDSEQYARMELLLSTDPEAQAAFVNAMSFESLLQTEFPPNEPLPESIRTPPVPAIGWLTQPWSVVAVVAVASLVFGIASYVPRSRSTPSKTEAIAEADLAGSEIRIREQVATITAIEGSLPSVTKGERLSTGVFEIADGHIEMLFDCGALINLAGPAKLSLEDDFRVFLHYGSLSAEIPKQADGFVVRTPTTHVRDLGTSFGLRVKPSGETELHVLKGSVEATTTGHRSETKEIVYENQALLVTQSAMREVAFNQVGFNRPLSDRSIPDQPPRKKFVHWSFDQSVDHQVISTDGSHAMTLKHFEEGTPPRIGIESGVFGGGLDFSELGQYAISDYFGVESDKPRTVAFWVRLPDQTAEVESGNCLLSWGVPKPSQKWEVAWTRPVYSGLPGALRVGLGTGQVIGSTDLRDALWHHVAVVFHRVKNDRFVTQFKLYIDGRLERISARRPQRIATETLSTDSSPVTLGRYIDERQKIASEYFLGMIDELYIIEDALTPQQIVSLRDGNAF